MEKLVLASGSPRRKEILEIFNYPFEIMTSDIEEPVHDEDAPEITVMTLALEKSLDISQKVPSGTLVIGADTLVYCQGYLGKPQDEADAQSMLNRLQGRTHHVYTGISVVRAGSDEKVVEYVKTAVRMKPLNADQIATYVATGEPMGKAGAYAIQGKGALFIDGIEGDYFNVVGLPIQKLAEVLELHFGCRLMG